MKSPGSRTLFYDALSFGIVFLSILAGAKVGQYLFFGWQTSPAVIWPPTGIALAILWLGGYRYITPIFLALVVAAVTGPLGFHWPGTFTTAAGQMLGVIAAVALLKRLDFADTFPAPKHVAWFLLTIVLTSMVAPTITTCIEAIMGTLSTTAFVSWSRAWAGYTFSCLILFPFIVSWALSREPEESRNTIETSLVGALLVGSVYGLFWIHSVPEFSFFFFTAFFIAHFWLCFRFSLRMVTSAIFFTTVFGMVGLFVAPAPDLKLNNQLFSTELFLFIIVPIFYAFFALIKESARTLTQLREAKENIEKENTNKNEFIAILAHELRNPLSPVKTTLELLDLEASEPETKKLIQSARQQVHSMRRLLDDLLDITRVNQGKFQLRTERTPLAAILNQSIASTKQLFTERNHTVEMDSTCDEPLWLIVDPVRFEQVIVNILNNAAKYTTKGGHIKISQQVNHNEVAIKIQDNGVGIQSTHLESIFKPFWQVRPSPSPAQSGGIGVGLSLTKHIVEMHGGSIKADSAGMAHGTTIIVTLPLAKEEVIENQKMPHINGKPLPQFRILIVDDNQAAANSLAKLLTLKGNTADMAYSGTSALEVVEGFIPDIILLDIGLPDINGFEVAATLRLRGYTGQLIALSGYGQREDKEKARRAGFDTHMTKPMGIATFEAYMRTQQEAPSSESTLENREEENLS